MCKVLCKNCTRFYNTGADQCNIPNIGITLLHSRMDLEERAKDDSEAQQQLLYQLAVYGNYSSLRDDEMDKAAFFVARSKYVHTNGSGDKVYGRPSELNYDNACKFYDPNMKEKRRLFLEKYLKIKIKK